MLAFTTNCTQEFPSNTSIKRVLQMSEKTQFGNSYMEIKTETFPVNLYICVQNLHIP